MLNGLLEDRAAHDRAGCVEAKEIAASRFVEIAISLLRTRRGHYTFAQMSGTLHGRLDQFEQLQGKCGAQKIVLLAIKCALNILPCRRGRFEPGILHLRE